MNRYLAVLICVSFVAGAVHGSGVYMLHESRDDIGARADVCQRPELTKLRAEYEDLRKKFLYLHEADARHIFASTQAERPEAAVLPIFAFRAIMLSGIVRNPHSIFCEIDRSAFIQLFFYSLNEAEPANEAVIYLYADDAFVPLRTQQDFEKRLQWDRNRFEALKRWTKDHAGALQPKHT